MAVSAGGSYITIDKKVKPWPWSGVEDKAYVDPQWNLREIVWAQDDGYTTSQEALETYNSNHHKAYSYDEAVGAAQRGENTEE